MSFLTGVDLEGRIGDNAPQPLVLQKRKSPQRQQTSCLELLDHREPVQYGNILQKAIALQDDDPLEELRRMIRRTQGKMDRQTKVLNGFIDEVNKVNHLQRNFNPDSDIDDIESLQDVQSTHALGNGAPALAASQSTASKLALAATPGKMLAAPAVASTALVTASEGAPARQLRALAPAASLPPPSGKSRGNVLRSRGPSAAGGGAEAASLGQRSASSPSLAKLAGLHEQQSAEPLTLPARRPPPGSALHQRPQEALSAAKRSLGTFTAARGGTSGGTSPSGVSPSARFPLLQRARSTPKFDIRRA